MKHANHEQNVRLVETALDHMARRKAPSTVATYQRVYVPLLEWLAGDVFAVDRRKRPRLLADLKLADLNAFVDRPTLSRAPATVKLEVMALRALFRLLHEQLERLPRNPSVGLQAPGVDNEEPKPVPDAVWMPLWLADLGDDDRVALGLARYCGLRRMEVTRLSPTQFTQVPEPRIVGIKRKGGKTQGFLWREAVRWFDVKRPDLQAGLLVPAVERLLEARRGRLALFPWADERKLQYAARTVHSRPEGFVAPDHLNKRLRKLLMRTGQRSDAFSPHGARHAFCTDLINTGMPLPKVSRLMGHASAQVTMRYVDSGENPWADHMADAAPTALRQRSRWQ